MAIKTDLANKMERCAADYGMYACIGVVVCSVIVNWYINMGASSCMHTCIM